jgi:Raf kinase inhibitor-like YbhB/YbcL family protein
VSLVVTAALAISSPAFHAGGTIPADYACSGRDVSPALHWSHAPRGTRSFALRLDDPDAPGGTFTHWTVWNIPAQAHGIATGYRSKFQGRNSFGRIGYSGPCPPAGSTHRYVFRLYALNGTLTLPRGESPDRFASALRGHVLSTGTLIGRYGR